MVETGSRRYRWAGVVLVGAVGVALLVAVDALAPENQVAGAVAGIGLLGAAFQWAYLLDTERLWWAIIPSLSMFTLIAAMLVDTLVGTDPSNDWASGLTMGIGAAIIGAVLKRADAKMTLYVVAAFAIGISVAMAPTSVAVKAVLIALDVVATAVVVYGANRGRPMVSSRGWLHPHP